MHSKGANGINIADEFTAGKISALPKTEHPGRQAAPLDDKVLAKVRAILTGPDGALFGSQLYTATAEELSAYNLEASKAEPPREPIDLVTLARRFAFAGAGNVKRYATAVAKETGLVVSVRVVNEQRAEGGAPAMRWVILLREPNAKPAETA
jgi:hypothetical protein